MPSLIPAAARSALLPVACVLVGVLSAAAAEPRSAWRLDFDQAPLGPVSAEAIKVLSPAPVRWSDGFATAESPGRFRVVGVPGHGRVLEVLYPRGGVGPRQTGGQWEAELPPGDTYLLEYRVRFGDDFDWVQGGKLPGLGGGTTPTGGFFDPDGFTSRYMWRKGGRLVVYLYWAGQASAANTHGRQYGVDLDCGVTLERGRFYLLRQRVTMNTPGRPDGVLEVWVDGEPVLRRDDLLFRDQPGKNWQIDRFFFSTFHGGNDASWAPAHDCSVQFDEFVVAP
ncbi:MAG: hypothetical protein IAE82_04050 [Opitutaceae bacterium]|nr:hypothetical protein [Opitutaceae bacterium]